MKIVCPNCLKINSIPQKEEYKKANCGACKSSLLNSNLIEADVDSFDEIVVNSDIPVVIDFWAPWCGPCKVMSPVFEALSKEFALKTLFVKVNTETQTNLGSRFAIRSIPTLLLFKEGREIDRVSGALDKNNLKNWISRF